MSHRVDRIFTTLAAALVLVLALSLAMLALGDSHRNTAAAASRGKVGYSGNPEQGGQTCARCHRSGGGQANMRFWGRWSVEPGTTYMYTVTVGGTDQESAGFNVSASGGTLRVPLGNADVRQIGDELTHLNPKSVDFGTVHFNFLWTAPEELGNYVLYGAGNSVDLDGTTDGDNVVTDTLQIVVEEPVVPGTLTATATPTDGAPTTPPPLSPTATETPTTPPTTASTPSATSTVTPTMTTATHTPEPDDIFLPVALASWDLD